MVADSRCHKFTKEWLEHIIDLRYLCRAKRKHRHEVV